MKSNLFFALTFTAFLTFSPLARSQDQPAANQPDTKQRARAARELVKQGQDGIPSLAALRDGHGSGRAPGSGQGAR